MHETGVPNMKTVIGIAAVLALYGATNLAHAADIPGVLGDPGTATKTAEASEQPTTATVDRYTDIQVAVVSEKAWAIHIKVKFDLVENRELHEERKCAAYTAYNPETGAWQLDALLAITYSRKDPDKAGVHIGSSEPLNPNATSQIDIGNRTLQLTNPDDEHATFTSRKNRIALIDAIMRGRTATFSSHGPNGFIQRTFSLAGATAMAELAARLCDANTANPGKSNLTPTARRKTTGQPTQQVRTTTQSRQHQTQTTTQYEEDGVDQALDAVTDAYVDQGMQIITDAITDELLGDFGL